jgi:hypothetical protein
VPQNSKTTKGIGLLFNNILRRSDFDIVISQSQFKDATKKNTMQRFASPERKKGGNPPFQKWFFLSINSILIDEK